MKIYIILGALIAALFVYILTQHEQKAALKQQNAVILQANKDLNATLSEVILKNKRDTEILQERHEKDLQNALKTQKALEYVKKSDDSNASQLFNDTILLLQ